MSELTNIMGDITNRMNLFRIISVSFEQNRTIALILKYK